MPNSYFTELVAAVAARLQTLPDKPEEDAEATVRALWHKAAGHPLCVEAAVKTALPDLDASGLTLLQTLISRRLAGTPLAHLTGRQQFMQIEFLADARALIPRKETELLGYSALNILNDWHVKVGAPLQAIDLCTGAGNLACALAHHQPRLRVVGSDISLDALACARENSQHLKVHDRVGFVAGDLLEAFDPSVCRQSIAMIICNPPYISNAKVDTLPEEIIGHEPRAAFAGGPLGVSILNRLVKHGADYLVDGGWICCEVGLGQGV